VQHAVREMESRSGQLYDAVILLQATAPLCRPSDISACIARLAQGGCDSVVTVVTVDTHPFRMKRIVGDDVLVNFIDQGFEDMRPRQVLPPVYRRSGAAYVSRRNVVMEDNTIVGANARAVVVPRETAVDIDSALDFEMVRLIYGKTKEKDNG
jgi:CMP-N-acetylneuraminic acid synthetase